MRKIRSFLAGALALAASFMATPAQAGSSCQYITTGAVLTAAQWNSCFQAKQNELNYTPVNRAGDGMQGLLTTIAATTSTAGFRIYPGVAPSAPTNGDVWTTSTGMFVRINGATVGPLRDGTSASFAGTSPITVSFPSSVITYAFDFSVANTWTATQTMRTILAGTTNTFDVGTSATVAAFRTIYAGTSFVGPIGTFTTSVNVAGCTIGANALCATGSAAISGALTSAAHSITSASSAALAVGLNGATNPALQVDASTALSVTGLKIKSAAAAGGVALSIITSGTNEPLTIDAAGSGTITLGSVSTGAITLTRATTLSAALTYGAVTFANTATGSGSLVGSISPTFTGTLAAAAVTATTLNGNTFTTGTYTLTGVAGKTLTFNKSITLEGTDSTTMTFPSVSATIPRVIANNTKALATGAIASATCTTAQTDTATGALTSDSAEYNFASDPTAVTGYTPLVTGMLAIIPYITADTMNFKVCNNTTASITPGAISLNWRILR